MYLDNRTDVKRVCQSHKQDNIQILESIEHVYLFVFPLELFADMDHEYCPDAIFMTFNLLVLWHKKHQRRIETSKQIEMVWSGG